MKKLFATAVGIYNEEDFAGPPPFPFEEVYAKTEVENEIATLVTVLDELLKAEENYRVSQISG